MATITVWNVPGASLAIKRDRLKLWVWRIARAFGYPRWATDIGRTGPGPHPPLLVFGVTRRHVRPYLLSDGRLVLPYAKEIEDVLVAAGFTVPAPIEIDDDLIRRGGEESDPEPESNPA